MASYADRGDVYAAGRLGAESLWHVDWRPTAPFIAQLIAERDRLPPQRDKRRAPVETASGAYAAVAMSAARRLPAGYRTTRLA